MLKAIIQLEPKGFEEHFRGTTLRDLTQICQLIVPDPVSDLTRDLDDETLANVEVLLTGWGSRPLDAATRARMPQLKLVAHLAGTVKHVLSPDLLHSGVRVTHAAAANAFPVAQYVLGITLLHNKRVLDWSATYHEKRSALRVRADPLAKGIGNRDKIVGIVGASRVGRCVIDLLRPHGMTVLLHDPYLPDAEARALGCAPVSLDQLLAESDVVSLHQPLLPSTRNSFGAREFALMRDGTLFVNTARGAIVDHAALTAAMADGRLSAVLDVTDPEPLPDGSPLWDMPNVMITPHVAGSLGTEVTDMTRLILEEIRRFSCGEAMAHELLADVWERVA